MEKTYIYALMHPTSKEIRYVGKTECLNCRLRHHINNARKRKYHCANWIESLLNQGLEPKLFIIEICSKSNWKDRELYWIWFYRQNYDLTNLLDGGNGGATYGRKGIPWSDQQRINNRKSRLGVPVNHTKEGKKNRADGVRRYFSENKTPVYQFDLEGNLIKKWPSAVDAGKSMGILYTGINTVCRRGYGIAHGYRWSYTTTVNMVERSFGEKEIVQYSKTGDYVQQYESLSVASKETGISRSNISNNLNNRSKSAGGYVWKYKNK